MKNATYRKTTMGKYITDTYNRKTIKKLTNRKARKAGKVAVADSIGE